VLAGTQSGKTALGPPWLWREVCRRGPGDYLVVAPTYPLLALKALPEFLRFFESLLGLGEYVGSPVRCFTFSEAGCRRTFGRVPDTPTRVYFGHASDPDSLESATAKAAWLDEAGQKRFRLESWEAVLRRLAVHRGRALVTTTPYDLGWLKRELYDRWQAGDPDVEVVRFESTENPAFPREEYERARASMPAWRFDLFYRAMFSRPAGMVYDCFDEAAHVVPPFALPINWPRYLGLDFGGVNTAGLFYAAEPGTRHLYLYREYKAGGRTAAEHGRALLDGEPMVPVCVGGSKSEGQWRAEFAAGGLVGGRRVPGLPVREPDVSEVEVGIARVYGAHKRGEIRVFSSCKGYLEEKLTYAREVDERGLPTEKIDDPHAYHFMDAERYIIGYLRRESATAGPGAAGGTRPVYGAGGVPLAGKTKGHPWDPFGGGGGPR
jgi:hypothetical protein